MPTITKTFSFNSNQEGWVFEFGDESGSIGFDSSIGNPSPGSLYVQGGMDAYPAYFTWTGTWENLGVPSGEPVVSISISSVSEFVSTAGFMISENQFGPYQLRGSDDTLLSTLLSARNTPFDDNGWVTRSGSPFSVSSGVSASSSTIKLRINAVPDSQARMNFDQLVLSIDYGQRLYSGTASSLSKHPTFGSAGTRGTIVYTGSSILNRHPSLISGGTRTPPKFTGVMSKSVSHGTFLAASTYLVPIYHGQATLAKHPLLVGIGGQNIPNYFGTLTLQKHPSISNNAYYIGPYSGSSPLFIKGGEFPEWIIGMPLFTTGISEISQVSRLFIAGIATPTNSNTPLIISGYNTSSFTQPLFLKTIEFIESKPSPVNLFIQGPILHNSNTPLYIEAGGVRQRGLGLYVATPPAPRLSDQNSLYIQGHISDVSVIKSIPIYVSGWRLDPSGKMNLFISSGSTQKVGTSSLMNLVLTGGNPTAVTTTDLFICNLSLEATNVGTLFIQGQGDNPGYTPYGGSIGLIVNRGPNAGIPLFIANNNVPAVTSLFISGRPTMENQATLIITGSGGNIIGTAPLSIRYATSPTESAEQATLVIPEVIGSEVGEMVLYVHGWGV